jgi:hypothetical protein
MTCASAYCKLEVRGTENNKKVKSLSSYSNMSQYWATPGFSASANVNVSSFVSGSNGHCAFQYAVMTGSSSSLTIGWNGSSYTLPSGGHGQSGGEYIIPSDLN